MYPALMAALTSAAEKSPSGPIRTVISGRAQGAGTADSGWGSAEPESQYGRETEEKYRLAEKEIVFTFSVKPVINKSV